MPRFLQRAVGVADLTSVHINSFATHKVDPVKVEKAIREVSRLTPKVIIQGLAFRRAGSSVSPG